VQDSDYFHLIVAVFLALMLLVMAAAVEWHLHHPALDGGACCVWPENSLT
jgi:hypothetical protein